MKCNNCGTELNIGDNACPNCGTFVDGAVSANADTPLSDLASQPMTLPSYPHSPDNMPPIACADTLPANTQSPIAEKKQQIYKAAPKQSAALSMGSFLGIIIIMAIPVLNLIMALVWSFSEKANPNRRNISRAFLLLMGIGLFLIIIALAILVVLLIKNPDFIPMFNFWS